MPAITIQFPDELVQPMRDLLVEEGETNEEAILRHLRIRAAQVAFDQFVLQKDNEYKAQQEAEKEQFNQQIQAERQRLLALWGVQGT